MVRQRGLRSSKKNLFRMAQAVLKTSQVGVWDRRSLLPEDNRSLREKPLRNYTVKIFTFYEGKDCIFYKFKIASYVLIV